MLLANPVEGCYLICHNTLRNAASDYLFQSITAHGKIQEKPKTRLSYSADSGWSRKQGPNERQRCVFNGNSNKTNVKSANRC